MLSKKVSGVVILLFFTAQSLLAQENYMSKELEEKIVSAQQFFYQEAEARELIDKLMQEELQSGEILSMLSEETKQKIAKYALGGIVAVIVILLCYKGLNWMSQSPEAQRNLAEAERIRHQARRAAGIAGDFLDLGARLSGLFGD